MNWYKLAQHDEYPIAGTTVDGLQVAGNIPNTASIGASFTDYTVLKGIRELPLSDFGGVETIFYAADDIERSKQLAEKIRRNGRIDPLIIVVEDNGPYILEGAHRFVALLYLEKTTFPALVVVDESE